MKNNYWKIKPQTKTKLEMLRDIFDVWLTIWNAPRQQKKVDKEWYILDLFAGRGYYEDRTKGSPLVFLERILLKKEKIINNRIKIKLFFVDINKKYIQELKQKIQEFTREHPEIKKITEVNFFRGDCNKKTKGIIKQLKNNSRNPLFLSIDPWGINIKKETIKSYLNLFNPIDIIFNFSEEGRSRAQGIAIKPVKKQKEIKTTNSLEEFLGKDVDYKTQRKLDILKDYIKTLFITNMYHVVGFDMEYPDRKNIIYYLLFASKNNTMTKKIVKEIFAKYKERYKGLSLFGEDFYFKSILSLSPKCQAMPRQTLLYKTKVEYGDWTINHIRGCMHGCRFPCYAMLMAKKFGWIKTDDEWRKPKIAKNAIEMLEQEILKYKNEIKHFVHLCFMSDPFMYDYETQDLVPEVKEMTLKIIERLNKEGIKVNTLTKGFYPDEILDTKRFLQTNEYGITLVSLNEDFKQEYEPYSAPYEKRIESLKKLAKAGLKTWVSMEPYPTPQLPRLKETKAENIDEILNKIKFVKKIVFGKLNYSRLNYYNGNYSLVWGNNSDDFYKKIVQKVIDFCKRYNIKYHIKLGTPGFRRGTMDIFKE